jgi:hypothetical protein
VEATAFGNTDTRGGDGVNDAMIGAAAGVAYGVAVDGAANAFLAGQRSSSGGQYFVQKFTGTGALVQPFGDTDTDADSVADAAVRGGSGTDSAQGVALDTAAGFVAVTGYYRNGSDDEIRTYRFSTADGSELWSRTFDTAGETDRGLGVALGSIVVGGYSFNGNDDDVRVLKYSLLPPAAPSGLSATAVSSSQINLAWTDNSNNEDGFRIERGPDGSTWTQIASVGAGVTSYSNTGLSASTASTAYHYRVRAYNAAGNSGYTGPASATTAAPPPATPAAPTGLAAVAVSSARINLSWTDASGNEDGFRVERSSDGAAFSPVGTVPANVTSYADTGLPPSTTRFYRVRAFNSIGDSAPSNGASATTGATVTVASDSGTVVGFTTVDASSGSTLTGPGPWPPIEIHSFPFGMFSFRIIGLVPGATVQVTITLTSALPSNYRWYWYHPRTLVWSLVPAGRITTADDRTFVITLTDGGFGDSDGSANGTIDDPVGPAVVTTADGSNSNGPCSGAASLADSAVRVWLLMGLVVFLGFVTRRTTSLAP